MMSSWMGSHFTNDDLVKESRMIRDYDIELSFDGDRDGVAVYEFVLIPRPEAPVVWGKIVQEVRQDDLMPTWARYYDEDGELKRVFTFHDFQQKGGRLVPTRLKMSPTDKSGEYTEVTYKALRFDIEIPGRTFSLSALRK